MVEDVMDGMHIAPDSMMDDCHDADDEVMLQAFLDENDHNDDADDGAVQTGDLASPSHDEALVGASRQISDSTRGTDLASTTADPQQQQQQEQLLQEHDPSVVHTAVPVMTGRPSIPLYLSCNPDHLSEYQCAIRKNVELFEASEADVTSRIKGRNKPIVLGQVGIRCIHCSHVFPVETRERGSMYYPHALVGIYQAAQILSQQHLLGTCPYVPPHICEEMQVLKNKKSFATAGKEYWAETAKALGVYEDQYGLRFVHRLSMVQYPGGH
jgi:hypothetical protein